MDTTPIVEHGQLMSGGGFQIRNGHPDIERIYPLRDWIRAEIRSGGKIYRRTIVVIEDWTEVK
jgi:hypothetical protein